MVKKLLMVGLILAFSLCYTEWGADQSAFIFEIEYRFFADLQQNISAFSHPLILAGLLGQLGLIYGIIVPNPRIWIIGACLVFLSLVVGIFLIAGLLSLNFKIIGSTLPFFILSLLWLRLKKISKQPR